MKYVAKERINKYFLLLASYLFYYKNYFIGVTSHVLAVISRILALQKSLTAGGAFSRKFISLPYFEIAAILVYFPDLV